MDNSILNTGALPVIVLVVILGVIGAVLWMRRAQMKAKAKEVAENFKRGSER